MANKKPPFLYISNFLEFDIILNEIVYNSRAIRIPMSPTEDVYFYHYQVSCTVRIIEVQSSTPQGIRKLKFTLAK